MVMMLIEGLGGFEGVEKCLGDVEALDLAVCPFTYDCDYSTSGSTSRCLGGAWEVMSLMIDHHDIDAGCRR